MYSVLRVCRPFALLATILCNAAILWLILPSFECGMFPGSFYLISMWYKRKEAQKRYTFFFASTSLAGKRKSESTLVGMFTHFQELLVGYSRAR